MTTLTLPYPPSTNRLWRHQAGRVMASPEAKAWKHQAAWIARAAGLTPIAGPVAMDVTLHPKLTSKGRASRARIDLDNALKAGLDALQGIAYADDKQITRLSAALGYPLPDGGLTVHVTGASATEAA